MINENVLTIHFAACNLPCIWCIIHSLFKLIRTCRSPLTSQSLMNRRWCKRRRELNNFFPLRIFVVVLISLSHSLVSLFIIYFRSVCLCKRARAYVFVSVWLTMRCTCVRYRLPSRLLFVCVCISLNGRLHIDRALLVSVHILLHSAGFTIARNRNVFQLTLSSLCIHIVNWSLVRLFPSSSSSSSSTSSESRTHTPKIAFIVNKLFNNSFAKEREHWAAKKKNHFFFCAILKCRKLINILCVYKLEERRRVN